MKKECEIIGDLLLGYSDETLNAESKKMVEEHLKMCDECKRRLGEIKKENKSTNDEVKALKYFKKFRRKNILRTFFIIIGIFILIILGMYLRKVLIISKIQRKIEELYSRNNIYSEQISLMGDGKTSVFEKYYKDRKIKDVTTFYSDSGEFVFMTNYSDLDKKNTVKITNYTNTYEIEENKKFDETTSKTIYLDLYDALLTSKFELALTRNIDVIENGWGKYYVFTDAQDKAKENEFWIDAETLLPSRRVEKEAKISFYNNTKVVKEILDQITLYNYSFDTVTEDDVKLDLTNVKKLEVQKTLSPFGFAGSSLHKVELWTNGDVYVIVDDGSGIEENSTRTLIMRNVEDIEENRAEEKLGGIIIKGGEKVSNEAEYDWIDYTSTNQSNVKMEEND